MHWLALGLFCLGVILAQALWSLLRRRQEEARAYLKGVRYVLSDDPDAAIEALSDAARLGSPEAVETYLALGVLFRRAGDFSRAIRLHRNMLMQSGLSSQQRAEVERELADDYLRSGMTAEAIAVLEPLTERGDRAAIGVLRDERMRQGDLLAAAALQRRLGDGGPDPLLAHILAALARQWLQKDRARAQEAAQVALAAASSSADALLAMAEVTASREAGGALTYVARALDAEPEATLLAWPALATIPAEDASRFLDERLKSSEESALHFLKGRLMGTMGQRAESLASLSRAMELDASGEVTLAMRELLRDAETPDPQELPARHDLMVAALVRQVRPLRCRRCDAASLVRTWRCPQCGSFEGFQNASPACAPPPRQV